MLLYISQRNLILTHVFYTFQDFNYLSPCFYWLFFSLSCVIDWPRGYKWHEFLSIIPPPFALLFFLACAVKIKDCWAKGKKDSINLHLSLTVTFTWQSAQHSVKCSSLLPKPWLVPLKYCFFLYIKFYLMGCCGVSAGVEHIVNLQDHEICLMTLVMSSSVYFRPQPCVFNKDLLIIQALFQQDIF